MAVAVSLAAGVVVFLAADAVSDILAADTGIMVTVIGITIILGLVSADSTEPGSLAPDITVPDFMDILIPMGTVIPVIIIIHAAIILRLLRLLRRQFIFSVKHLLRHLRNQQRLIIGTSAGTRKGIIPTSRRVRKDGCK